jgi:hypothetical protein
MLNKCGPGSRDGLSGFRSLGAEPAVICAPPGHATTGPRFPFDLLLDRFEVERGRSHRRKIDRRLGQGKDFLLHLNETLELTGKDAIHITRGRVVPRLTAQ